ncbi:TlpA disulfide reductase family protein [Mucilaginibacter sp. BT774]|uniref:TlpA family protein disulfide reductase n=1 Tax=Mucilaginibacter sp. BT774 TaxID=3062276 RepID=UPI002675A4E6|nr:TlpA disulfide reductase family protein [Mucilaginibacter sp. BT774]MDO3627586.1 TlpA disulfide reductase family protein [Mucilaginibacter sp. BT774]
MKNKLKYIVCITMVMLLSSRVKSQQIKEVHIGEQVPDIKLSGFYNDSTKVTTLKDLYQNKLLLLDFWGSWCGSCIIEFPKLIELKKKFGEQIAVVSVGYESYQKINSFFKRHPELNSPNCLVLTKDSVLTRKMFPHKTLPHLVWINSSGKVVMISEGEDVTEANIKSALANQPIIVRPKIDNMSLGLEDIYKPFHIMDTNFMARSIFTRTVPGWLSFEGLQGEDSTGLKFNRAFIGNLTFKQLYWIAAFHHKLSGQNNSRLIFEVKDSLKYMMPQLAPESFKRSKYKSYSEWESENLYCYDLVMPHKVPYDVLYDYMLSDLNRYLNLNGRFEQREMDCYVLKKKQTKEQVPLSAKEISSIYYDKQKIENLNINQLTDLLNQHINEGYIVNESGLPLSNQFRLNVYLYGLSVDKINSILAQFGLVITPARRKIPVYVVSERD